MSSDPSGPFDGAITSEETFDAALKQLLTEAHANDVDPIGSWVYRNGSKVPDWEVQVSQLVKRE